MLFFFCTSQVGVPSSVHYPHVSLPNHCRYDFHLASCTATSCCTCALASACPLSLHHSLNALFCAPPPALIVLISYAGTRGRLYCSSPDLYASIAQSSVFCEIGGEYKVTSVHVLLHKNRYIYAVCTMDFSAAT